MGGAAPVRVVVADDSEVFREGLVRLISRRADLELAGEAAHGLQALELVRAQAPDVVVLDVRMPELTGPDVLDALLREGSPTRVVFLSAHVDPDLVVELVATGAAGFLSKEASRREICDAVVAAARGETVLPPDVQRAMAEGLQARRRPDGVQLTGRELDVLRLTAEGLSSPQIGRQLHLSSGTVKTHLANLYEKLGVSDRAAAVAEGMRRGLLT